MAREIPRAQYRGGMNNLQLVDIMAQAAVAAMWAWLASPCGADRQSPGGGFSLGCNRCVLALQCSQALGRSAFAVLNFWRNA